MKRQLLPVFLFLAAALTPAFAGPRDAASVLDYCGHPLKSDTIILEDTVAGGRRILSYERGDIHFDKVANIGWTFTYGSHRKLDHLTAEQMEKYMPCLKLALAASAAPEPLPKVTPVQRVEVSVKHSYKEVVLFTVVFLAVLWLGYLWYLRGTREQEEPIEEV